MTESSKAIQVKGFCCFLFFSVTLHSFCADKNYFLLTADFMPHVGLPHGFPYMAFSFKNPFTPSHPFGDGPFEVNDLLHNLFTRSFTW